MPIFSPEIAVYPGSAQDLGVLLGLHPVKTFVLINDKSTTRMSNQGLDLSLKNTFNFQVMTQSDEYDVYYHKEKDLTVVSVKNCFWPKECTPSPFVRNLIRRAKYYIQIGTLPNPSALRWMPKVQFLVISANMGKNFQEAKMDGISYRWKDSSFKKIIVLSGTA